MDPLHGWTYHAKPLPALDTYTRHTIGAQYLYGLLGPEGLRLMTPTVVYVELLAAPLVFLGSYWGSAKFVNSIIGLVWSLHIGISITIRNTVLLSLIACAAWCVFLPTGWEHDKEQLSNDISSSNRSTTIKRRLETILSAILICSLAAGNIWFELIGSSCADADVRSIWSTLFQNRWNVFVGAEEYVLNIFIQCCHLPFLEIINISRIFCALVCLL